MPANPAPSSAWAPPHPVLAAHAARLAFSMRLPGWQHPPQSQAALLVLAQALSLRLSLRPDLSLGLDPTLQHEAAPGPIPGPSPAAVEASLTRVAHRPDQERFLPG